MQQPSLPSLYDRLGGAEAVEAVVALFYEKVLADRELSPFFRGVQMSRQHQQQVAFFTQLLGGPPVYQGRDMRSAHKGLGLTARHFGLVAGHLVATLKEAGVAQEGIDEVVARVAPLQPEVLDQPV